MRQISDEVTVPAAPDRLAQGSGACFAAETPPSMSAGPDAEARVTESPKMRIVLTLLVRDEEEILEDNLDYHFAQGVDHIVVTDNRSIDSTPAILERYRREGRVTVIHEPDDDYNQSSWVTRMAVKAASDLGADWLIHSDADEFWWPKSGDLRSVFESIPGDVGSLLVDRSNFLPAPGSGPFHQRMVVREAVSFSIFGGPIPAKVCHRATPEARVGQGNHTIRGVPGRTLPVGSETPLFILHYPMRSYEQFEHKIALGGAAYERNTIEPWESGSAWRLRYEDYKAGRLRTWWEDQLPGEDSIERGLGDGSLVLDRRLQLFFAEGQPSAPMTVGAFEARPRVSASPPVVLPSAPAGRRGPAARLAARASRRLGRQLTRLADRLTVGTS